MGNKWGWSIVWTGVALGFLSPSDAKAQWGTIKGKVTLNGKVAALPFLVKKGDTTVKDSSVCAADEIPDESLIVDSDSQGIANVVIWLAKKPASIHPDLVKSKSEEVSFDQKGCRFFPHVLLVRTDQSVRVLSDDAIVHNTHTFSARNKAENLMLAPSDRKGVLLPKLTLEEKVPVGVICDIHPWMKAWWVVLDHPYAAVTNVKGEFEIADLPVGDHEFRVWQERAGYVNKSYKISVKAGDNKLNTIEVPATVFNK